MKPDVIILGGGPNGLATALSLGSHTLPRPLRVLLLDGRDPWTVPADSRGTALTLGTQAMFQALGVWESLEAKTCEMRNIVVTDATGPHDDRQSLLAFATEEAARSAAAMVENRHLTESLLTTIKRSPNITLQGGFAFTHFEVTGGRIALSSKIGEIFSAPLLVAADGRHSLVRSQLGIALTSHDYRQTALSFAIAHTQPHQNLAEEHFSPDGVFAFLPLPENHASIVWGTTPEHAQHLMALDDAQFNAELQVQMGERVGQITLSGKRNAYPLSKQIAHDLIGPRVALLGDAAHAIHPLAGLGLNLGFKDAASLADCVMQAFARGEDIGGPAVLEKYQSQRRFETMATSLAMDGMNALFSNDDPALKRIRGAGLLAVDRIPTLKAFLMSQAAGQSTSNPRLLQGLNPG